MISQLLNNNYKEILKAAKNITRRRNYQQAPALINETYLFLHDKETPKINNEFVKYFTKTMHYLYIGERSTYNKAEKLSKVYLEYDPGNDDWKDIEVNIEINKETLDTLLNLSHLKNTDAIKYANVMQLKETLPPHEREIFELHFDKGLSGRQIAKIMELETGWKMSYVRYNEMIKKVKLKLNGTN
jgi:RNA polymerase sigma factor (sigma-70 family)